MLVGERRKRLVDIINSTGSVSVETMAVEFGVTPMTIRRDLKVISQDGRITRCHGGAVLKVETDYVEKMSTNHSAKYQIAKEARELVKEGAVLFIDAGTTTYELAMHILDIPNLIVVTNDLKIASKLSEKNENVIICGGQIQKSTGCVMGYYASHMMGEFTFDIGFFGAPSIDDNFNVSCPTIEKAFLKKQLVKQCILSYLLVDAGKFGKSGMNRINSLSEYSGVVTDCRFSSAEKERLVKLNINIIQA